MPILPPARLAPIAIFAVVLGFVAWGSMALTRAADSVATVWPVNALAAAFLVRWAADRTERIATLFLSAAALAAAHLLWGAGPAVTLALVGLYVATVAASAWMLRRIGPPVARPRAFAAFIAGPVLAVPVVSAAVAALVFAVMVPQGDPLVVFARWSASSALGMAIVGAFALTVGREGGRATDRAGWLRYAGAQILLAVACIVIIWAFPASPLFLMIPFLVLGAISHRELGGVTAVAVLAPTVVTGTLMGRGPASLAWVLGVDPILLMQIFLAAMVFAVLPISALLRKLERYEIELEERRARAEELNALKSRLLAYVGHEIRSPLSGVTSLAELMRDGVMGQLTSEQQETLAQIASTGAEVEALARDLTDAAAIEAGKASINLTSVHVGEAIRAAVNLAQFRTAQHRAEVRIISGSADALRVRADPLRLRQILVNLLVNGAKYGGRPPVVTIVALQVAGRVRFEVADNGQGIAPDRRDDLFNPFERLGAEASTVEGAGLGLALSQEMARLQKGSLRIADSAGGGCFWLELPLCDQEAAPVAA